MATLTTFNDMVWTSTDASITTGGCNWAIGTTATTYPFYSDPPKTLQDILDFCNNREMTSEDIEWLEYNIPFGVDLYEQLQKIESKLKNPFSAAVKRKFRKLKLDRIKI